MKINTKHLKLISTLIMLVVAVLCVVNASYAYFTALAEKNESVPFSDLNVKFVYRSTPSGGVETAGGNVLELYSASGTIKRETPFGLSLTSGGSAIAELALQSETGSCDSYVRFWIDAYLVNNDGSLNTEKNYGKFFVLSGSTAVERGTATNNSAGNLECYYATYELSGDGSVKNIGNTLTLTDTATEQVPVEVLGGSIRIFISLDAVQKSHSAFKKVFNDSKGYYNSWT